MIESSLAEHKDAGRSLPPEYAAPARLYSLELAGTLDRTNRYSATVELETTPPAKAGINGLCNGVLVGPRLALTAGHCVCMRKPGSTFGQYVIDTTSCATAPVVTTMVYPSTEEGLSKHGTGSQRYQGVEVWPHPAFKIVLDANNRVISRHADLALILLDSAVNEDFVRIPLSAEEVLVGESIVMVGGTFDEFLGGIQGQRRFIRYKVERGVMPGEDWIAYVQPKRDLYRGSSGGPCVSERPSGPVLVGISSRGFGEEAVFTLVHPYRDWLISKLQSISSQ